MTRATKVGKRGPKGSRRFKGLLLKKVREELGLTQEDLAAEARIDAKSVYRAEAEAVVALKTVQSTCSALEKRGMTTPCEELLQPDDPVDAQSPEASQADDVIAVGEEQARDAQSPEASQADDVIAESEEHARDAQSPEASQADDVIAESEGQARNTAGQQEGIVTVQPSNRPSARDERAPIIAVATVLLLGFIAGSVTLCSRPSLSISSVRVFDESYREKLDGKWTLTSLHPRTSYYYEITDVDDFLLAPRSVLFDEKYDHGSF